MKKKATKKQAAVKPTVAVEIWEQDSWSGPSLSQTKWFRTEKAAINFCDKFNTKSCPPLNGKPVPEYYVEAHLK